MPTGIDSTTIRPYLETDVRGWLHCRLLAFFDTCYYDDVHTSRTRFDLPSIRLVAETGGAVAGLIDVEINGTAATIDCIAVHPDHQRSGLGGALLNAALELLPFEVSTLDAWTREDPSALAWYTGHGFTEQTRYLHVYKGGDEAADGFATPEPLGLPVFAFCHAKIEHEQAVRARFRRVYICRQFLRRL